MRKRIAAVVLFLAPLMFGQFGQNKVQYKDFVWYYIQTTHFDIYFSQQGGSIAEFSAKAAEDALASIQNRLNYKINNRIVILLYNSQNDFQETNVTDEYLTEGIGGFTELFKNRVVLPFTGNYKMFRHVIHHELVHAVINDMFYGGSVQNIISNNINIRLPLWFNEGLAEYLSLGWDTNTDMYIRDASTSEYLPDIDALNGYFAYRGGQAVFSYIAKKYGEEKVGELVNKIKSKGSVEEGLMASIGLNVEELNERWKKEVKRVFWPDVSLYKDPDEFSKRLTDHRKDGGFYNTSPCISPQGDKIAFISNRDFFFDVYLMNASDGKIIKRLVKGNRSADFEELNILTPGLTWSPDGTKLALAAKSSGLDVIYIIDVESEDISVLPHRFDGIGTVRWSPDGSCLAFSAHNAVQSDIYVYNLKTDTCQNITADVFSDEDPAWSPDGKTIFFASDRGGNVASAGERVKMYMLEYGQADLYAVNVASRELTRITNLPMSSESSPVCSPDGKELLFISDANGINNIYRKRVLLTAADTVKTVEALPAVPVTNSLNGLYQLSLSADGKKMSFSSMYQAAFNVFLLNNPFEINLGKKELQPTRYVRELTNRAAPQEKLADSLTADAPAAPDTSAAPEENIFMTGQFVDSTRSFADTVKNDYSNYVFGQSDYFRIDTTRNGKMNGVFNLTDNLDSAGNYRVNRYKITFSPDIVYANAGYSSLYGLLGTTVISFSDVLGNHRLIGQTSLQIDLKNSDYGLAYYYLPRRYDLGIEGFHTARFVYLERPTGYNLFRFRNYGAVASLSYPLSRYYRIDAGLSFLNVSSENLDDPEEPGQKVSFLLPAISFTHDNTIFGYTSPIDGTRFRFDLYGNPLLQAKKFGFYSLTGDYRSYFRFWYDYSFAFRLSGGLSNGPNAQRFFIGGIENWINRSFSTGDIPLSSPSDFAFLTAALPLRGFNYAEQIGTKYTLMNLELRFPLIRYLLTGALPILFRDVLGVAFIDMGTAWDKTNKLQLFQKRDGVTVNKDLLTGTGVGARLYFLYFLLRFDVAWSYDMNAFSRPKFYFSLGADF